jgi:hypothetical protein
MNTRGAMVIGRRWVLSSMIKGDIVVKLVVIDFNPRRSHEASLESSRSDGCI